jgi:hypothetical protein
LSPQNLRAAYQLAEETERQSAANSDSEFQGLIQNILAQPGNLAAMLELEPDCREAWRCCHSEVSGCPNCRSVVGMAAGGSINWPWCSLPLRADLHWPRLTTFLRNARSCS